ncbi:MAG: redoxin domain-containing protein, partial [Phyllobacterium sp.]
GIGFLAINANDAASYPADSYENMQIFARANDLPFPYLHDRDQAVAKTYGAVCTPDFFGFNAAGELQYRGRLDASRKELEDWGLRRDLFEAMVEIADTGQGPRDQIASIGCSIKWRDTA